MYVCSECTTQSFTGVNLDPGMEERVAELLRIPGQRRFMSNEKPDDLVRLRAVQPPRDKERVVGISHT